MNFHLLFMRSRYAEVVPWMLRALLRFGVPGVPGVPGVAAVTAAAMETRPVQVVDVVDGNTVLVQRHPDDRAPAARLVVHLLYVDAGAGTPGASVAKQMLEQFCKIMKVQGAPMTLWCPGDHLDGLDTGEVSAVVRIGESLSLNQYLIMNGLSRYWRKHCECPDPQIQAGLRKADDGARLWNLGLWATNAEWMTAEGAPPDPSPYKTR